jgi:uncharacterized protein (DUF1778 family)
MKNKSNLKLIPVRVESDTYELLKKVSKARGEQMSVFIRRAILRELARLSFLPEEQKKALTID